MIKKPKILAICGSTRQNSSNLNLIKAISALSEGKLEVSVFEGLAELPYFNPDLNQAGAPAAVADFRREIAAADGILICTPEYAMGVPGILKNALDWTVSSMEFAKKPVALITAASSGEKAHASLLGTLLIIEAKMTQETQLLIPFARTKIKTGGHIDDSQTLYQVLKLIRGLTALIKEEPVILLTGIPEKLN